VALRFRTKPFEHQLRVLEGGPLRLKNPDRTIELRPSLDRPCFGLFHEPGLGKSKSAIDYGTYLADRKDINGMIVLAPNGVHRNWEREEIPTHMPEDLVTASKSFCWNTGKSDTKTFQADAEAFLRFDGPMTTLMASYDSLMTKSGANFIWRYLKKRRCLMIGDESHFFKTPSSKRTLRTLAAAQYAPFRRALTGTLVDNSPFDVYTQIKFLNDSAWDAIGCSTAAAFRAMFGVWQKSHGAGGREFDQLVDYKNLDILHRIVDAHGSRLLKDDVLDLPPKLYTKRHFELTPVQRRAYQELREEFLTIHEGGLLTAPLAITRMIRLQQVTSGYLPTDADKECVVPLGDTNPRLSLLMEVVEEIKDQPTIIWAKYNEDVRLIMEALRKNGYSAVQYDGSIGDDEKLRNKERFQKKGDTQFFVSKSSVGGTGLTLTRAQVEIFYNTTFGLGKRKQAEDRVHRIGLLHPVLIIDLVAMNSIDGYILRNLREGRDTAAVVMGDPIRAWI
jgi:SNF2 family DNA or RNA helicase